MGILKSKLKKHIRDIGQDSEVQAGFTKNRRIADNLFVLDYCVKESYKIRKPLFLISIDFAKAFDSVKRDKLVNVLKKYRIHPDIIVHIYNGDITKFTTTTCSNVILMFLILNWQDSRLSITPMFHSD